MSLKNLSWGSRLALMDRYGASVEQASAVFGVSSAEVETARELRDNGGSANLPVDVDVEQYGNPFSAPVTGATAIKRPGKREPAQTATKITPEPKKRGRKGAKINSAFAAIGTDPIPAEEFAETRGVSLNVLRQAKRFDTQTGVGRVRVKKIEGVLMVFSEAE